MSIRIAFPAQFADLIDAAAVEVEGKNVGEALRRLTDAHPALTSLVWPRDGSRSELNPILVVFLNGHDVRSLQGLVSPLQDGDELLVISAVEGG
jgi:molybdopterin synthase sulfur carrier subunit